MLEHDFESVLLLFPMADGQTGLAIRDAFENLGIHVESVDPLTTPPGELMDACEKFGGDLVLCGREKVLAERAQAIRKATGAKFMVVWNPDVRYDIAEWDPLMDLFRFPVCSAYYTVGMGNLVKWRNAGVNAWWLPQGLQPELYQLTDELTQEDWDRYGCDVSFIGGEYGMHEGREEVLDALESSELEVKIWGCRGNPEVWGKEHNTAVACSKVCLCHSGWPAIQFYWSVRAYKVMGAAGFVLANNHTGMAKWLPISGSNRILDHYGNVEECLDKARYWVDHETERGDIAVMGHRWVMRNTYTDRIRAMLSQLSSGKYFEDEQVFNPRDLTPMAEEPFNWIFEEAENGGPDGDREVHSTDERKCDRLSVDTRGQDGADSRADNGQTRSAGRSYGGGAEMGGGRYHGSANEESFGVGSTAADQETVAGGYECPAAGIGDVWDSGSGLQQLHRSVQGEGRANGRADREGSGGEDRGRGAEAAGGYDRPGPHADAAGEDEQGGGGRFLVTVGDQACEEGLLYLLRSLRKTGWYGKGSIRILTPSEPEKGLTRDCEALRQARSGGVPGEALQLVEVPSWHEKFMPDADFPYYNSCWLKLFAMRGLEDGDRALFVDGADTLVLKDPGKVLDLLNMSPLLWVPAEPGGEDPLIPGFCELFGLDPEDRTRANDGVFAFEVCPEVRHFFSLWRALSAWAICYGMGDMTAFNMALTLFEGHQMPLHRRWNYLSAYSDTYREGGGSLIAEDDVKVHILHGAGSGREKFLEVRDRLFN